MAGEHPELHCTLHKGNIGLADDCRRVVRKVIEQHGRLDILVNNAGITIDRTYRAILGFLPAPPVPCRRMRTGDPCQGSEQPSCGAGVAAVMITDHACGSFSLLITQMIRGLRPSRRADAWKTGEILMPTRLCCGRKP